MVTQFITVGDLGLGDAIVALATKVIQFAADILYTIATFGIDLLSQPAIGGLVVTIMLVAYIWRKRATKRVV